MAQPPDRSEPLDIENIDDSQDSGDLDGIDSNFINQSYSTRAPNVRPSFFRFVRYHSDFKLLFVVAVIGLGVGFVMWIGGIGFSEEAEGALFVVSIVCGVIGFLLFLLGVGTALLLRWMWKHTREHFANGLLTPGILLSREPLHLAVLANMSNGMGDTYWGIRRLELPALPIHENRLGARVPCSSTFQDGSEPDRWGDCNPEPLCLGTGNRKAIQQCLDRLDESEFAALQRCIDNNLIPKTENEIAILDENFDLIEIVPRAKPSLD